MIRPKHTIASVTQRLIDGLEEGTVVLDEEKDPEISVEVFQARLTEALTLARRITSLATIAASVLVVFAVSLSIMANGFMTSGKEQIWTVFHANEEIVSTVVGLLVVFFAIFPAASVYALVRVRGLLKLADKETAQRIARYKLGNTKSSAPQQ